MATLLEQMKEADAAQANNLGQALAPAIEGRFQALTKQRYQGVRLTAHLATEGVHAPGAAGSPIGSRSARESSSRRCTASPLGSTSLRPSSWTISSSRATATVWTGSARCSETRLAPFRSLCSRAGPMALGGGPWCRIADPSTLIPKTVSSARLLSNELRADDERLSGREHLGATREDAARATLAVPRTSPPLRPGQGSDPAGRGPG